MIILDTNTRKIQLVLAGAKATSDSPVTAHFVDAPAYLPAAFRLLTNGVTVVDVVTQPAGSVTRHIKLITLVNEDTAPITVSFRYNDTGVLFTLITVTLAIGDSLAYTDGEGWRCLDKNGNTKFVGVGNIGPSGPQGSPGTGMPGIDGKPGRDGMPGMPGVPGTTGSTGAPGSTGPSGTAGPPGIDGKPGSLGFPGTQGPQGPTGSTGGAGPQGATGSSIPGIDGKPGPMGFPIPGPTGPTGPQGNTGGVGPQGKQGNDIPGLDGKPGSIGLSFPGPTGPTGPQGNVGPQGASGTSIPGIDGKPGPMGFPVPGPSGPPGTAGAPGNPGATGAPGPTVPVIDGKPGKDGFSIPGAVGPTGSIGPQGTAGAPGAGIIHIDGKPGKDGFSIPGPAGPQGVQGVQGIPGVSSSAVSMPLSRDGVPGPMGFPGPPGPIDGTKISALVLASSVLDADDFPVNEAGTTKRVTGTLFKAYVGNTIRNQAVADQTVAAATLTYITNSNLAVPIGKLRIGTRFTWEFFVSKTAFGVAARTWAIVVGTLGTTGDTARVSFVSAVPTAVADTGYIKIVCTCRGPLSAAGIFQGGLQMTHNLQTTGLLPQQVQVQETTSAGFDVTVANLIVGLVCTTGAAEVLLIKNLLAEAKNL